MGNVVFVDSNGGGLAAIAAAQRLGHRATFVRSRRFADLYASPLARERIAGADRVIEIEDSLDPGGLDAALRRERDGAGVDALVTVFDFAVLAVAESAARLGIRFTSAEAVRRARRKDECRRRAEAAGAPPVPCVAVETREEARAAAERIGYPVILKPSTGGASLGAARIADAGALDAFHDAQEETWRRMPMGLGRGDLSTRLLVERFVEGPLISVEIGRTADGAIHPFMVGRRTIDAVNPVLELATTMPAPLPDATARAAVEQARLVVEAIGLDLGIFHVEFIASPDGPRLVEVNPRLMGGNLPALYNHATAADLFEILVRTHLGESLEGTSPVRRAVCSRLIAAGTGGPVRRAPTPAEMASLRDRTVLLNLDVREGQAVEEFTHSFNAVGHFVIDGSSPEEACMRAEAMVGEIASYLQIPLK